MNSTFEEVEYVSDYGVNLRPKWQKIKIDLGKKLMNVLSSNPNYLKKKNQNIISFEKVKFWWGEISFQKFDSDFLLVKCNDQQLGWEWNLR